MASGDSCRSLTAIGFSAATGTTIGSLDHSACPSLICRWSELLQTGDPLLTTSSSSSFMDGHHGTLSSFHQSLLSVVVILFKLKGPQLHDLLCAPCGYPITVGSSPHIFGTTVVPPALV